jgi:hypothetical protein
MIKPNDVIVSVEESTYRYTPVEKTIEEKMNVVPPKLPEEQKPIKDVIKDIYGNVPKISEKEKLRLSISVENSKLELPTFTSEEKRVSDVGSIIKSMSIPIAKGLTRPQEREIPKIKGVPKSVLQPKIRTETKPTTRIEPKINLKPSLEPMVETRVQPRILPKIEPSLKINLEPKIEARIEPKLEMRLEPKLETKLKTEIKPNVKILPTFKPSKDMGIKKGEKFLFRIPKKQKEVGKKELGLLADLLSINVSVAKFGTAHKPMETKKMLAGFERKWERVGPIGIYPTSEQMRKTRLPIHTYKPQKQKFI